MKSVLMILIYWLALSGVGKTRILVALETIFGVALGREKLNDFEWTIDFFHLDESYTWFLKSAISDDSDIFEIESKQFEVIEERLTQLENKIEIFNIASLVSKLNEIELPKIKKTESIFSLLPEEDLIYPLVQGFERIFSSKSLNQAVQIININYDQLRLTSSEVQRIITSSNPLSIIQD